MPLGMRCGLGQGESRRKQAGKVVLYSEDKDQTVFVDVVAAKMHV